MKVTLRWLGTTLFFQLLHLSLIAIGLSATSTSTQGNTVAKSHSSPVRTYYIAADEVEWNYAPRGHNIADLPVEEEENEKNQKSIYLKAIYREYTDETFTRLKARQPEWEHLGILGPLIRATVGDTLNVVFKNNARFALTIHPHGLEYAKSSEGAFYLDGTGSTEKADDRVRPGQIQKYVWTVPERCGPGPHDGSSVVWMYHSHYIETRETNTGLMGAIIVTAKSMALKNGRPKDVDREFVTAFAIFDETRSQFYATAPLISGSRGLNVDPLVRRANTFYTINGLIESNLPLLVMKKGERVRWYIMANSNEEDVHSVHWHGQTALVNHMRMDMLGVQPMMSNVADMVPDSLGTWLLHCHVDEHMSRGMNALFKVIPSRSFE